MAEQKTLSPLVKTILAVVGTVLTVVLGVLGYSEALPTLCQGVAPQAEAPSE